MAKRIRNKKKIVATVFAITAAVLIVICSLLQLFISCADKEVYWHPDYPM